MTIKILEVKTKLETKSIISLVTKNKAKLQSINDGGDSISVSTRQEKITKPIFSKQIRHLK
jgi:hypothetical protein